MDGLQAITYPSLNYSNVACWRCCFIKIEYCFAINDLTNTQGIIYWHDVVIGNPSIVV